MKTKINAFPSAYALLRKRLGQVGWIALGSLVERRTPGRGGPRYQWSRAVAGKTVTVALSAAQFEWLQRAIDQQREVWDILEQMQRMTLQFMWNNIPGPSRRKRLSNKTLGLN